MSFKAIFFIIVVLLLGVFVYLKIQVAGGQNSGFNQTTRFVLGKNPLVRTILGLHNAGDARAQYLGNSGPLVIEWFKPGTEEVDGNILASFASLAEKYTGRKTQVVFGGDVSEGTLDLQGLQNLGFKGPNLPSGADVFHVVFAADYQPKDQKELSTTHGETTVVISLNSHKQFLGNYQQDLNEYLLSSLLHEFGHEIGLGHNSDPSCIMSERAGIDGLPLENSGLFVPQDFCPAEVVQINQLKLQY